MRAPALDTARRLVGEMFPSALAAWLGGSVVRGDATDTSDLDITVLLAGGPAPYRHSLRYGDWPVELFVHTGESFEWFLAQDLDRRQPSLARLVAESVLVTGEDVLGDRARCFLAAGSPPLTDAELAAARYAITDLLDDLTGSTSEVETVGIATRLWEESLRLLLTGSGRWAGVGKGLVREVVALDPALADRSVDALRSAVAGSPYPLVAWADEVLAPYGGRLFDGYRAEAPAGSTASTRPPEPASP